MRNVLRVGPPAGAFASLIESLRQAGERAGWLELAPPSRWPEELEAAAGSGVLRAVAVGGGRSVAVKPMRGAPVLRDLLREHFRGCLIVLVRGGGEQPDLVAAPWLEPRGEDWLLRPRDAAARALSTDQLIAALRSPRRMKKTTQNRE